MKKIVLVFICSVFSPSFGQNLSTAVSDFSGNSLPVEFRHDYYVTHGGYVSDSDINGFKMYSDFQNKNVLSKENVDISICLKVRHPESDRLICGFEGSSGENSVIKLVLMNSGGTYIMDSIYSFIARGGSISRQFKIEFDEFEDEKGKGESASLILYVYRFVPSSMNGSVDLSFAGSIRGYIQKDKYKVTDRFELISSEKGSVRTLSGADRGRQLWDLM